jgi:hypothetical protein
MGVVYVARSAKLAQWASDVGLSKHVFKLGYTDADAKALAAAGWAGEQDWVVVKQQQVETPASEEAVIARLAAKEKMVDPSLYPRIKGALGIFKIPPARVENHIIVGRALAGAAERLEVKLKPADFAAYMIHNAIGGTVSGAGD